MKTLMMLILIFSMNVFSQNENEHFVRNETNKSYYFGNEGIVSNERGDYSYSKLWIWVFNTGDKSLDSVKILYTCVHVFEGGKRDTQFCEYVTTKLFPPIPPGDKRKVIFDLKRDVKIFLEDPNFLYAEVKRVPL